jgi:hypothetical protein
LKPSRKMILIQTRRAALLIGVVLLGINVAGLVLPLQNPELHTEKGKILKDQVVITAEQFYKKVQRSDETIPEYATQLNEAVHQRLIYYEWGKENGAKYWRLPIHENYLIYFSRQVLYLYRWIRGELAVPGKAPIFVYEFADYRKVVERGIGLCAQHAVVVCSLLQKNKIACKMVMFNAHVVVIAQVDPQNNVWWLLDSDYGVVVPHDFDRITLNPHIAAPYYQAKGYDVAKTAAIVSFFSQEKTIADNVAEAFGKKRYYFEVLSYYFIWIIPIALIIFARPWR